MKKDSSSLSQRLNRNASKALANARAHVAVDVPHSPSPNDDDDDAPTTSTPTTSNHVRSFEHMNLHAALQTCLKEKLHFSKPTQVQTLSIPPLIKGKDVLVQAPTGSGKTLAFLLPLVHRIISRGARLFGKQHEGPIERAHGTVVLVVSPTRELSLQIESVCNTLLYGCRMNAQIVCGHVIGGEKVKSEKSRLRKGITVLCCTPGRLLEHLKNTASFRVDHLKALVLDEADRLLELGFMATLREILEILERKAAPRRQTALFSATLLHACGVDGGDLAAPARGKQKHTVAHLAELSLNDPAIVRVGAQAGASAGLSGDNNDTTNNAEDEVPHYSMPSTLVHASIEVPCKERLSLLVALLRQRCSRSDDVKASHGGDGSGDDGGNHKAIVFMSAKDSVMFHHTLLGTAELGRSAGRFASCLPLGVVRGVPLYYIHGDLPQDERAKQLLRFSKAPCGALLCTDVASRGLDLPAVNLIVQFDCPGDAADYVHRAGRCARTGAAGTSVLFLRPCESEFGTWIEQRGVGKFRHLDRHDIYRSCLQAEQRKRTEDGNHNKKLGSNHVREEVFALQRALQACVARNVELHDQAMSGFRSFVRAYAAHPAAVKYMLHVQRLHLGHVAQSFGLKEAPTLIGKGGSKKEAKRKAVERKSKEYETGVKRVKRGGREQEYETGVKRVKRGGREHARE
ncbi:hypothetical protein PPROV_000314200 [Pycnococcus provasolii]|uniref:ATP-dependent RNA helicase n=1 Tax=Pycnococcus provasolii TaxID=41880 RepID=A0A830HCC2_9CHLO|nr:hypothetical protein PPROV_000314200 [Pycnococcus provasolii]